MVSREICIRCILQRRPKNEFHIIRWVMDDYVYCIELFKRQLMTKKRWKEARGNSIVDFELCDPPFCCVYRVEQLMEVQCRRYRYTKPRVLIRV